MAGTSERRMNSLFSEDLFTCIQGYIDKKNRLQSAFHRLSAVLRDLQPVLNLDGDIGIRRRYRSFCRSVKDGKDQTAVVADLMDGVQSLKQNRERWARIDRELGAAIEGTNQQPTSYQFLTSIESELMIHMDELKTAENELSSICRKIRNEKSSLFEISRHGTRFMSTSFFWRFRYAPLVAIVIIVVIGSSGISPFLQQLLYGPYPNPINFIFYNEEEGVESQTTEGINFPFGVIILSLLGAYYKYRLDKYESERIRDHQEMHQEMDQEMFATMDNLVSEVCNVGENPMRRPVHKSTTIAQVKFNVGRFFEENIQA